MKAFRLSRNLARVIVLTVSLGRLGRETGAGPSGPLCRSERRDGARESLALRRRPRRRRPHCLGNQRSLRDRPGHGRNPAGSRCVESGDRHRTRPMLGAPAVAGSAARSDRELGQKGMGESQEVYSRFAGLGGHSSLMA